DETLATSEAGVFAAGEITGIGGGYKSLIEGRLAAMSILASEGETGGGMKAETPGLPGPASARNLRRARRAQLRFGAFLAGLGRVPKGAWEAIPDETVICRCEDVTLGEIRRRVAEGFDTPGLVKKSTRSGMGNCQGRTCGPMIEEIVGRLTGRAPGKVPPLGARPPVKAVRLDALAAMAPIP
ncbi:MAG: (2Fe-2S)-binding protein, partial [Pseudomonadales bacterium]|nr:(2Fe-2S)-binding protein [Pseudomonadales bacterium]